MICNYNKSCPQACYPCRGQFCSQRACPTQYSARVTPTGISSHRHKKQHVFKCPSRYSKMTFNSHKTYIYVYLRPFIHDISHYNIFQSFFFFNLCCFMISCKSLRNFWSKLNKPQLWEEPSASLQINQHVTPLLICPVQQPLPHSHTIRKYISYQYEVKPPTRLIPFQMSPSFQSPFFLPPPTLSFTRATFSKNYQNCCVPKLYMWVAFPLLLVVPHFVVSTKWQGTIKNPQSFWLLG